MRFIKNLLNNNFYVDYILFEFLSNKLLFYNSSNKITQSQIYINPTATKFFAQMLGINVFQLLACLKISCLIYNMKYQFSQNIEIINNYIEVKVNIILNGKIKKTR